MIIERCVSLGQMVRLFLALPSVKTALRQAALVQQLAEDGFEGIAEHWLESRARLTPSKTADFGAPTSSRFRQETGKDWRMWSSISFIGFVV